MWQAEHVRECLIKIYPDLEVRIIGITTQADKFLDKTLASMGGKGVFVKELEQALLDNTADIAVHSMKDVPIDIPEGLNLPVIMQREDARDAFVSNTYEQLESLPEGASVGTSSLRRRAQLKAERPDLDIQDIRGNVGTRLKKLDNGQYDALILAMAGLKRLQLTDRIKQGLDIDFLLPAVGQGALGIETREHDDEILQLIAPLGDAQTHRCLMAERAISKRLNGGCHAPIAAYADITDKQLFINALVGRVDGTEIIRASVSGPVEDAEQLGDRLGVQLIDMGADRILNELSDI